MIFLQTARQADGKIARPTSAGLTTLLMFLVDQDSPRSIGVRHKEIAYQYAHASSPLVERLNLSLQGRPLESHEFPHPDVAAGIGTSQAGGAHQATAVLVLTSGTPLHMHLRYASRSNMIRNNHCAKCYSGLGCVAEARTN